MFCKALLCFCTVSALWDEKINEPDELSAMFHTHVNNSNMLVWKPQK